MKFLRMNQQVFTKVQYVTPNLHVMIGVLIFYLLILVANLLLGSFLPIIATVLSWLWYLLPGLLISFALIKTISWWERLPIGLVLTIGLCTPITVAAILFTVSLPFFVFLHSLMLLIAIVIFMIGNYHKNYANFDFSSFLDRIKSAINSSKGNLLPLIILVLLVSGLLISLSYIWPLHGDDIAGLAIFAEVIQNNRITGTEPFHGTEVPSTPRNELIVWTYMQILVNKVSNENPTEFIKNSRPILVLMAILSMVTFLRHFFKDKKLSLFLFNLWGLYLLSTSYSDGTGSNLITRIFQDKFVGWFIVIPVVLVFLLWFLEKQQYLDFFLFGIVVLGASMIHPITLIQVIILIGGFGLAHIGYGKSNIGWRSILLISIVLTFCLLIPFVQFLRYNDYIPLELVELDDVVELGRLNSSINRYRLWLLSGDRLILHPTVFLQPIIIAAYLSLPFIFYRIRDQYAGQMILGTLIIVPILLYFPPFAFLVGKVVTPYLMWRLAWPIPLFSTLTVGWGIWFLFEKFELWRKTKKKRLNILYYLLVIIPTIITAPNILNGLTNYFENKAYINYSTCVRAENALSFIDKLATKHPVNLLSTSNLNFCIPGYAGSANVVEFRGYGTINRLSEDFLPDSLLRLEDIDYFTESIYIDERIFEILKRYNIDYVLIEKDNMDIELQLKYSSSNFSSVFEDRDFHLFKVKKPITPTKIIEANYKSRLYQYDEAINYYIRIINNEPDNILAHLGLGLVHEGSGNLELAIESYQKAIEIANNEPGLHAHLANAYVLKGDYQKAINEYLKVTSITPSRYAIFERLGQIYAKTENSSEAKKHFEKAALLKAQKGTAEYYSILGDLHKSAELIGEPVHFYEKAVSIENSAENLLRLAREFISSENEQEAIEIYQQAIIEDRWGYQAHLDLGIIYLKQNHVDEAINELETAIRLRPTGISAYLLLGQAIREKSGSEAAINRMDELKSLNSILPGPYRSKAMLLFIEGNLESALKELEFNLNTQPKSTPILCAQGFILMADRQFESAHSIFNQVLIYDPNSISAHIGLSIFHGTQNEFDLEKKHLAQIVRLNPLEAWPHLLLAQSHMHQGKTEEAIKEIDLAIGLKPNDIAGYLARGNLLTTQMEFDQALLDYYAVLDIDKNNIEAFLGLGNIYHNMGELIKAENAYLQASMIDENSVYSKIKLAEIQREQGRIDEAILLEEAAYALSPDSDLAVTKLAQTYRLQGRIEEAKSLYEQVISKETEKVYAYAALAQLMAEEENDQHRLYALFNKLVQTNTESAEAYLIAGKFSMTQANYDQAEKLLQSSLSFEDVSIQNYLLLSELYQRQGDWENSLKTLQSSIRYFPKNAVGYNNLADIYLRMGDLINSEFNFTKAIEFDPGLISAYIGKSKIELINNSVELAEKILISAIEENPNSPQAYVALADFYESIGVISKAEENYQNAILVNPKDIIYYEPLAQFYIRQKDYPKSLSILQDALLLFGSKMEIYLSLGDVYLIEEQYGEAITVLQSAIEIDRSDVRPYLALADTHRMMGDWNTTVEILETALFIEPSSIEVNIKIGNYYDLLFHQDKAIEYIEQAVNLDRSHASPLIELARIHKNNQNLKEAVNYLEQAIILRPDYFIAYKELSEVHQIMGDYQAAQTIISLAIEKTTDKYTAYLAQASLFEKQQKWALAQEAYVKAREKSTLSKQSGLELANYLIRRNDLDTALSILYQLEKDFGSDSEIRFEIGNIFFAKSNWDEALITYKNSKIINDQAPNGYLGLAKLYHILGDQENTLLEYQTALEKVPDKSEIYYNLGIFYLNNGEFPKAYEAFQEILQDDPINRESLVNLEQLNIILGKPMTELSDIIKKALQTSSSEDFITISRLYQLRGDWSSAFSWIMRAIKQNPYDSENWLALGNHYQSLGQLEKALEVYDQAIKITPMSYDAHISSGTLLTELKQFDEAINHLSFAIEISPGKIEGYASLAKVYSLLGDSEGAFSVIDEAIIQVPSDYRSFQLLSNYIIETDSDQYLLADNVIQQALDKFPGIAELYSTRGKIYADIVLAKREQLNTLKAQERSSFYWMESLLERQATAETRSESRVIELRLEEAKQQYDSLLNQLKAFEQQNGTPDPSYETSMKYYDAALMLEPYNDDAIIGKFRLISSTDAQNDTIYYLQQIFNVRPYSSNLGGHLGRAYIDNDQPDKAIKVFNQILSFEPNNLNAKSGLLDAFNAFSQHTLNQAIESVQLSSMNFPSLVENLRNIEIKNN